MSLHRHLSLILWFCIPMMPKMNPLKTDKAASDTEEGPHSRGITRVSACISPRFWHLCFFWRLTAFPGLPAPYVCRPAIRSQDRHSLGSSRMNELVLFRAAIIGKGFPQDCGSSCVMAQSDLHAQRADSLALPLKTSRPSSPAVHYRTLPPEPLDYGLRLLHHDALRQTSRSQAPDAVPFSRSCPTADAMKDTTDGRNCALPSGSCKTVLTRGFCPQVCMRSGEALIDQFFSPVMTMPSTK